MTYLILYFEAVFLMESKPQNPEFRNNPENFHPCVYIQVHCRLDFFMEAINMRPNGAV